MRSTNSAAANCMTFHMEWKLAFPMAAAFIIGSTPTFKRNGSLILTGQRSCSTYDNTRRQSPVDTSTRVCKVGRGGRCFPKQAVLLPVHPGWGDKRRAILQTIPRHWQLKGQMHTRTTTFSLEVSTLPENCPRWRRWLQRLEACRKHQ